MPLTSDMFTPKYPKISLINPLSPHSTKKRRHEPTIGGFIVFQLSGFTGIREVQGIFRGGWVIQFELLLNFKDNNTKPLSCNFLTPKLNFLIYNDD
jgi:hypothetical protein